MKQFLSKCSFVIDAYTDRLGESVAWLTTVLMILICTDVFLRYLLSSTKTWIIELEWHLFSLIFLFGAAYSLLHDQHVRVDVFYEKFSKNKKRWINIFGMTIFLIPWTIVVLQTSWDYAINSWSFREGSSQPNGLPARYVIKFCIFLGFAVLLLQAISQLIKSTVRRNKD